VIRAAALVLSACLVSGVAAAQVYNREGYDPGTDDRYRAARAGRTDEARVLRVDPVFDDGRAAPPRAYDPIVQGPGLPDGDFGRYPDGSYARDGYARDGYRDAGYRDDRYRDDGYRDDGYAGDGYGDVGAASGGYGSTSRCRTERAGGYVETGPHGADDWRGQGPRATGPMAGSDTGRTMATVIGGVLGAVVGSQVGGGSGRFATSAIGTMVGGIAGREVYEAGQRDRMQRSGAVTVCDPVAVGAYGDDAGPRDGVSAYDVTYEYAGREYTTRTRYHPGDTIRVRVDVTPDE